MTMAKRKTIRKDVKSHSSPIIIFESVRGVSINVFLNFRFMLTHYFGLDTNFVCYDDKLSVIVKNVPCPNEDTRKVEMSTQLLEGLLTDSGGSILKPVMSSYPPDHLAGFNLTDIASSVWMNFNKSDLSLRLLSWFQHVENKQIEVEQELIQFNSCECLHNLTYLTNMIVESFTSSSTFNMCAINNTSKGHMCDQLLEEIEHLNLLSLDIQRLLLKESSQTFKTNLSMLLYSQVNTNVDEFIDQMLYKINQIKRDSEIFLLLHGQMQRALSSFKNTFLKLKEDFIESLRGISEHADNDSQEKENVYVKNITSNVYFSTQMVLSREDNMKSSILNFLQTFSNNATKLGNNTDLDSINQADTSKPLNIPERVIANERNQESIPVIFHNDENNTLMNLLSRTSAIFNGEIPSFRQDSNIYQLGEILNNFKNLYSELNTVSEKLSGIQIGEFKQDHILENMTSWHYLRRRMKRDTTGYYITAEVCQMQGTIIDQTNYMTLCSTCVQTTILDDNYFPRYLTEKLCSTGSSSDTAYQNGCLFQPGQFGGGAGGLCQQQQFHIVVLERIPGKCMRVSSRGQEMITDQWQTTTYPLRIGCECMVNQNSQFAKYVTMP